LDTVNKGPIKDVNLKKKAGLYLCHRHSGAKLSEIGSYFDMKDAAVSQASKRFSKQIEQDSGLKKILKRTEKKLRMSYVDRLSENTFRLIHVKSTRFETISFVL